jgi:DNA-binding NtrC family response regulator
MVDESGEQRARGPALVIEDDPVIARAIAGVLADAEYRPVTSARLAEARSAVAREMPTIVILDLLLEDEFGATFLEELAELPQPPSVVVVSAFPLAPLVAARHAVEVVRKPFDIEVLAAAIDRAVEQGSRPRRAVG